MSELESLLDRNKLFAETHPGARQPLLPEAMLTAKAIIIGCADMRVDPAILLGLEPGEAVVMRNIGGRVTPGLLAQLGMLGQIGAETERIPGGGGPFHLIVLQHTDCGITRLAKHSEMLAQYFQVPAGEVSAKQVLDPRAAIEVDVAALRAVSALPASWLLSGLLYDVATGRAETVVPPAPVRAAA